MTDSARDYALPIDGNTHTIPCGTGPVISVDIDNDLTLPPSQEYVAFLWVRQHPGHPKTKRTFTTRTGRQPWPDNAEHLTSGRLIEADRITRTVHVLEIP